MKNKIYIIGNKPYVIDGDCEEKFYSIQMKLKQMGYFVINPIERLTNVNFSREEAMRKNINDLMCCNAAYIMSSVNLDSGIKNIEIKLALDFNLTIILGTIDLKADHNNLKMKPNNKKKINFI